MNLLNLLFSETLFSRIKDVLKAWAHELSTFLCDAPSLLYSVKLHLKYKEVDEIRIEKVGKFYQPSPT